MLTFLQVFFAIFGVMDPMGNVPLFLSLTKDKERAAKQRIARKAVWRASLILFLFVFLGNVILALFQVSIESFRITGGLIMILIGLQILLGIKFGASDEADSDDVSVVPLATPLIAGPGMITTAVIMSKQYGYVVTLVCLGANLLLELALFYRADLILKLLGREGTLAFAKIMGLILMTIGVEFIRSTVS